MLTYMGLSLVYQLPILPLFALYPYSSSLFDLMCSQNCIDKIVQYLLGLLASLPLGEEMPCSEPIEPMVRLAAAPWLKKMGKTS